MKTCNTCLYKGGRHGCRLLSDPIPSKRQRLAFVHITTRIMSCASYIPFSGRIWHRNAILVPVSPAPRVSGVEQEETQNGTDQETQV